MFLLAACRVCGGWDLSWLAPHNARHLTHAYMYVDCCIVLYSANYLALYVQLFFIRTWCFKPDSWDARRGYKTQSIDNSIISRYSIISAHIRSGSLVNMCGLSRRDVTGWGADRCGSWSSGALAELVMVLQCLLEALCYQMTNTEQWRPWSDCASARADLGLRKSLACLGAFSRDEPHMFIYFVFCPSVWLRNTICPTYSCLLFHHKWFNCIYSNNTTQFHYNISLPLLTHHWFRIGEKFT